MKSYCVKVFDDHGNLKIQFVDDKVGVYDFISEFKDYGLIKVFRLSDEESL